jgi:ribonuclease R
MSPAGAALAAGDPEARVGIIAKRGRLTVIEPFFERGTRTAVDIRRRRDVSTGDLVVVRYSRRGRRAGLEIVRSLGRPNVARNVVEALMYDRGHQRRFPETVEREAAAAASSPLEAPRRDVTDLPTFTIDPATARDFDDALSVRREADGVRVWVHIADVSAFVQPGTALDAEAEHRGNSVYVPGAVEPMLPQALSSDACSLVPGEPRPTVTVEVLLGDDARPRGGASFYRSRIRSDARLTYDEVDEIFAGRQRAPEPVAEPLVLAREAAAGLRERRLRRGALGVESSEPEFEWDEGGNVVAARDAIQTESHWVIEHFMILANELVAERVGAAHASTIYRVHEQPDPAAVERLVTQLDSLDVPTPPLPEHLSPRQAGELTGEISARVVEYQRATGRGGEALTSLVLRSLKQAIYSTNNIGHAGLASNAYCHFTSPIRRYPDLVVHRSLLATLGAGEDPPDGVLEEVAAHCSATEREAAVLERDADDVCLAFLLERTLAEEGWEREFDGEVSGLIEAGAFVSFERGDGGAASEGFLPVRRMRGDYYDLNEERTALIGRNSARRMRLGDPLTVVVRSLDAPRGRVDLELARWTDT